VRRIENLNPKGKINPMKWFEVMGIISTSALFVPVIIIFALRLAWYKSFPALLIYYIIAASQNLLSLGLVNVSKTFVYNYGVLNNLLDAPLMFIFMTYFSRTVSLRKKMKLIIPLFILFEIIVIIVNGYNINSAIIVLAPGLSIALYFSFLFFIHQVKITIIHQKAAGKACIATSLLFAYGGYSFIYVVYYLMKTQYKTDTFIVYYLISIVSSLLISTGIILEKKRVRALTELQTARKELRMVYGRAETKTAGPKRQPEWKDME
jgi:hypothetical protein